MKQKGADVLFSSLYSSKNSQQRAIGLSTSDGFFMQFTCVFKESIFS